MACKGRLTVVRGTLDVEITLRSDGLHIPIARIEQKKLTYLGDIEMMTPRVMMKLLTTIKKEINE
jgi:hypothetical protein